MINICVTDCIIRLKTKKMVYVPNQHLIAKSVILINVFDRFESAKKKKKNCERYRLDTKITWFEFEMLAKIPLCHLI